MNETEETNNQQTEPSFLEKRAMEKQRNIENNANNVLAAASVAEATGHPVAAGIGKAVKVADKISGGRTTKDLGKKMAMLNKLSGGAGKKMQKMSNKLAESGVGNKAASLMNAKNGQKPNQGQGPSKGKIANKSLNNDNHSSNSVKEKSSDGGGASFTVSMNLIKKVIIALIPAFGVMSIICLFFVASHVFVKVIGLGNADELSSSEAEESINKKLDEESPDLDEEVTDDDLSYDIYIDDDVIYSKDASSKNSELVKIATTKYLKRKYSMADLEKLEEFYPSVVNLSKGYDENMVYDFFFKMYNLYTTYRDKYNVYLDLPLLMSTLMIESTDMYEIFSNNLSEEDRAKVARKKPIAEFDYYYDWSSYVSSRKNSSHDMEILAQNMVSKQVREICKNSSGKEVKSNILRDEQIGTQSLVCDEGETYSVSSEYYDIDNEKYKNFLKQFIEQKYYINSEGSSDEKQPDSGYWRNWKQCGQSWSNKIVPKSNQTICEIGCLITSVTIQIARSKTVFVTDTLNPGVAMEKYQFENGGNFVWSSTKNLAPNFIYSGVIVLSGMDKSAISKKLLSYDSSRYYIILAVSDKNKNSIHHYVALDYVDSKTNELYMLDPASSSETKVYSKYKVYKAHIYEKKD